MKKQLIALGVLGLAGILATNAFGFVLLNPARKWFQGIGGGPNDLPVLYRVNSGGETSVTDGNNGVNAVANALDNWESLVSVNLLSTTTTASNAVGNDGQNVVSFEDPANIVRNSIAVTLVGFYNSGQTETVNGIAFNRYLDADISFSKRLDFTSSGEGGGCSNEYDIESTATHEAGHALGLAHSNVTSALMYPSIGACQVKPLATDDSNGINTIYTPGFGGGGCTPSESRLGSLSCSAPPNGPNCLVVAATVVDNCGNGVGGASVTVQLSGNTGDVLTGTASTNSSGSVSFGLRCNDAQSTVYTTEVIAISSSPAWDQNDAANAPNPISCNTR